MPRLSLGLGVQNIRKVGSRTIFRILISGAGTPTSNGEYVWDGVSIVEEKPLYIFGYNEIFWDQSKWVIVDNVGSGGDYTYSSLDLITWTIENGDDPAPDSTLYYTP
jgi:hypothetical protein